MKSRLSCGIPTVAFPAPRAFHCGATTPPVKRAAETTRAVASLSLPALRLMSKHAAAIRLVAELLPVPLSFPVANLTLTIQPVEREDRDR